LLGFPGTFRLNGTVPVGTRGSSADLEALDVRVQHRVDQRRVNLLDPSSPPERWWSRPRSSCGLMKAILARGQAIESALSRCVLTSHMPWRACSAGCTRADQVVGADQLDPLGEGEP
jgi:hypothetical protein